jgi:hypothetical protein
MKATKLDHDSGLATKLRTRCSQIMSQSSGKKKKFKAAKLKLVAKNPRKIKAALRSWVDASDKADSNLFGLNDAPPWVERAFVEVAKVVMPGHRLPIAGEVDMEVIGEFFGRLHVFGKLYSGEIPMGPEVQAEYDSLQKFAASQPQSPERTAREKAGVQDLLVRVDAVQHGIPNIMNAALESSHEDTLKFNKGLQRGMNLAPDELVTLNAFERHTRTYFMLAIMWRVWVTCKSLREVYNYLCKTVGEQKIGSFKTFEKVCGKIGFSVRGRGRPSGKK